jgi:hypothetical protein
VGRVVQALREHGPLQRDRREPASGERGVDASDRVKVGLVVGRTGERERLASDGNARSEDDAAEPEELEGDTADAVTLGALEKLANRGVVEATRFAPQEGEERLIDAPRPVRQGFTKSLHAPLK